MTHPPDWKPLTGMVGFYTDPAGTMHIDAPEALKGAGYRPTAANILALEAAARQMAEETGAEWEVHE